jgi:hypothetical protein
MNQKITCIMVALLLRNLAAATPCTAFSMVPKSFAGRSSSLVSLAARFRPSCRALSSSASEDPQFWNREESQKRSFSSTRREAGKIVSLTDISDRLTYTERAKDLQCELWQLRTLTLQVACQAYLRQCQLVSHGATRVNWKPSMGARDRPV